MKKILLSLFCLCTVLGINAQEPDLSDARIGVRVGWDLNTVSSNLNKYSNLFGNGSGFSIGGFYNLPLGKSFYFEPGLSFFYNTIGIPEYPLVSEDARTVITDGSLRNFGFRIPFVAGYRLGFTQDIAVSVFTGPQLNIGLSMKQHLNLPAEYKNVKNNQQLYGEGFHRLDMQWLFGVRFHYLDNFIAEISGGPGLSNLLGGSKYKGQHLRRNIFTISVGYIF